MRSLKLAFAFLVASVAAFADPNGAWTCTVDSPQGPLDVVVTIKVDGDKLTGNVSSAMGEAPIVGTAKGDDLTFTMNFDAGGGAMVLTYKMKVDGDKIAGTIDLAGQGEMKVSGTKNKS